jgi:hypothetical protein
LRMGAARVALNGGGVAGAGGHGGGECRFDTPARSGVIVGRNVAPATSR